MVVPVRLIFVNASLAGTVRISMGFCEYPDLQNNARIIKIVRKEFNFIMI
jgi:hypothetical protein